MAERSVAPHEIVVPTVKSLKYTYNTNMLLSMGYGPTSSVFSLYRREERCYYGVNRAYSQANFT